MGIQYWVGPTGNGDVIVWTVDTSKEPVLTPLLDSKWPHGMARVLVVAEQCQPSESLDQRDQDFERLALLFRGLRQAWFDQEVKYRSPQRVWEEEDATEEREKLNKRLQVIYDRQTEEIIRGDKTSRVYCLTPRCAHDVGS